MANTSAGYPLVELSAGTDTPTIPTIHQDCYIDILHNAILSNNMSIVEWANRKCYRIPIGNISQYI